jgi:pimeloyl-ACP methyl ester carboxylesterase
MDAHNSSDVKPTIVLVHGAFAESASWNGVISLLQEDGFKVIAFANPLRGVKSDSDYLASLLNGLDGEIVLVGHSYGGAIISQAADGNDRVRGLVFVGGFAPEVGESGASLSGKYEGGSLGETLESFELPDGSNELYIMQDKYRAQFAADVAEDEAARMAAIPAAVHRFMAERAGSRRTVEVKGGSHSVGIPEAGAVVELILEAAAG